jgi:uncharacterized small protein (DUF1192 family)
MLSHRRKHGPESPSPASLSALLMSTRNPSVMELPSSPQASETMLNVLDLFIVKERAALQGEIQRLQAENESLVKGQTAP